MDFVKINIIFFCFSRLRRPIFLGGLSRLKILDRGGQ